MFFRNRKPQGPDFSEIDSISKAMKLVEQGILVEILLNPSIFGGQDVQENRGLMQVCRQLDGV